MLAIPKYEKHLQATLKCHLSPNSSGKTELGKQYFSYAAPPSWINLQTELKMSELVPFVAFRFLLKTRQLSVKICHDLMMSY